MSLHLVQWRKQETVSKLAALKCLRKPFHKAETDTKHLKNPAVLSSQKHIGVEITHGFYTLLESHSHQVCNRSQNKACA